MWRLLLGGSRDAPSRRGCFVHRRIAAPAVSRALELGRTPKRGRETRDTPATTALERDDWYCSSESAGDGLLNLNYDTRTKVFLRRL